MYILRNSQYKVSISKRFLLEKLTKKKENFKFSLEKDSINTYSIIK